MSDNSMTGPSTSSSTWQQDEDSEMMSQSAPRSSNMPLSAHSSEADEKVTTMPTDVQKDSGFAEHPHSTASAGSEMDDMQMEVEDAEAAVLGDDASPAQTTLRERYEIIKAAASETLRPEQTWYIIPASWFLLLRFLAYPDRFPHPEDYAAVADESSLKNMDIASLIDADQYQDPAALAGTVLAPGSPEIWRIRQGLSFLDDTELENTEVAGDFDALLIENSGWDSIQEWYGPIQPAGGIPRPVVNDDGHLQVELNPATYVLFSVQTSPQTGANSKPKRFTLSRDAQISDLHAEARRIANVSVETRLWSIRKSVKEITDVQSKAELDSGLEPRLLARLEAELIWPSSDDAVLSDKEIESGDCFALEEKIGDTWLVTVDESGNAAVTAGTANDQPRPLFGQPLMYADSGVTTRSQTTAAASSSPRKTPPGLRGLTNLGNTCFMNSGLQCLSNTPELSRYFQSGAYTSEINVDNPLGMGGEVANRFGQLIEQIWDLSGNGPVTPRAFKSMIGRLAPSFAGYGQQDTQELIAFLLDGLHEDLNRIHKKPYVEVPDWEGGNEKELAKFARKCWEIYTKRNDSAIVDLFQGQLKSTLICPECKKESITLDPFMYLTLPIPVKRSFSREVIVVPWDPHRQKIKVKVGYTTSTTFKDLKRKLSHLIDIPADKLLAIDQFQHKIYAFYDDHDDVASVSKNDVIVFHELPVAVEQSRGARPLEKELVVVPVYSRKLDPLFISLTKGEASSEAAIRAKIVERFQWEEGQTSFDIRYSRESEHRELSMFRGSLLTTLDAEAKREHRKTLFKRIGQGLDRLRNGGSSSSSDESEERILGWKDAVFVDLELADKYEDENMWVRVSDPSAAERVKKEISLADCLDEFEKVETLGANDLWYCNKCKKHQAATKQMQVYSVPDILVICLKRFSGGGWSRRKIDEFVDFPVEGFDLEDRVDERRVAKALTPEERTKYGLRDSDESLVYDLYAVDHHSGGLGGGHYIATCKNAEDGQWYTFNDSYVSRAGPNDIKSSSAYLLFYRRRTARPIGGKTLEKTEAGLRSRGSSVLSLPGLAASQPGPSRLSESITLDATSTSPDERSSTWTPIDAHSSPSSSYGTATEEEDPMDELPAYESAATTTEFGALAWDSLGKRKDLDVEEEA